jgi:hypothetical protein
MAPVGRCENSPSIGLARAQLTIPRAPGVWNLKRGGSVLPGDSGLPGSEFKDRSAMRTEIGAFENAGLNFPGVPTDVRPIHRLSAGSAQGSPLRVRRVRHSNMIPYAREEGNEYLVPRGEKEKAPAVARRGPSKPVSPGIAISSRDGRSDASCASGCGASRALSCGLMRGEPSGSAHSSRARSNRERASSKSCGPWHLPRSRPPRSRSRPQWSGMSS